MFGLPKPTNFADGQRQFFGLAMAAAGVAFCVLGTVLTGIIIFGPWSKGSETLRLYEVGGALASYSIGSIAVIFGLMIGGPVGRSKIHAGRDGLDLDMSGHAENAPDVQQSFAPPPSDPPVTPPAVGEGPHVL
jgi:hypothetical protein